MQQQVGRLSHKVERSTIIIIIENIIKAEIIHGLAGTVFRVFGRPSQTRRV
jgi:hypothetical protein